MCRTTDVLGSQTEHGDTRVLTESFRFEGVPFVTLTWGVNLIESPSGRRDAPTAWVVGAILMAAQTLALAAVGLVSMVDATARSVSFGVTLWALGACCGALAWLLGRRRSAARTPTLVWNVLLVPCAFTVIDGGAAWVGWLMAAVAVVTFVAVVLLPAHHPSADHDA